MPNRIPFVGDDFIAPPKLRIMDANLPENLRGASTYAANLLKAVDPAEARAILQVNTGGGDGSGLVIGTTADTAKAGNYTPTWSEIADKPTTFSPVIGTTADTAKAGDYTPTWTQVTGKPTTFAPVIGTTATTAKAGNYVPSWVEISNKPLTFSPTIGTTIDTAKAGNYVPSWDEISAKPSTFTPTVGTTASTAKAGNYVPSWTEITGKPTTFSPIIGTAANTAKAGNYAPSYADAVAYTTFTVYKRNGIWPGGTSTTWTRPTSRTDLVFVLKSDDGIFPPAVTTGTSGYLTGIDEIITTSSTTTPVATGFGVGAFGTDPFGA